MKHEPPLFDDAQAEGRSLARAEQDVRQGRLIGHAAMTRWLQSWGSGKRLAKPRPGD